jgi:heme-degrading monooxygenase HmoA
MIMARMADIRQGSIPMPRYITIGSLTLSPGKRPEAERIADEGAPLFAEMPGFESVTYFIDEEANEYGAVSIWASREEAQQAFEVLTPQFEQVFGDMLQSPIKTHVYEIYEHKQYPALCLAHRPRQFAGGDLVCWLPIASTGALRETDTFLTRLCSALPRGIQQPCRMIGLAESAVAL